MKTHLSLRVGGLVPAVVLIILAGMTGCEKQGQVLALREEFSRQLQVKDKTIDELNRKMNELRNQNDQLQAQIVKNSDEPDKLTAAVSEAVAKKVSDQNAQSLTDLKHQIDQVLQAVHTNGQVAAAQKSDAPASQPAARPTAPAASNRDSSTSSDPNRRKMRFDFN